MPDDSLASHSDGAAGATAAPNPDEPRLHAVLHHLYHDDSRDARHFRYGLIAFDIVTIAVFLVSAAARGAWWIVPLDVAVALVITVEFTARFYVEPDKRSHLLSIATFADVAVILSLLLPTFIDNLGFLRIARALRVLRSYRILQDLRTDSIWFCQNEDIITRSVNFFVFVFVVTSVVYVTQNDINPQINNYIDALYFTVTTLTTTGFGDITLQGPGGRLLSVIIMVIGVSLFLRLLQAIFRPSKIKFECPDCGLGVHEIDAVHCKSCGRVLRIPDKGIV